MAQKNVGDMLKQVTRIRKDIDRVNADLKNRYVEASVGDGLVQATFNGRQELVKIAISPRLVDRGPSGEVDLEMLEDMVLAAVTQGLEKSKALMQEEMDDVTGGLASNLPGLF
jgi:hypothetical protein